MMKKLFKLMILILIFATSSSFATNRWHKGFIKNVYPLGNGTVILYMDSSNQYCVNASGTPKSTFYLKIGSGPTAVSELGLKNIYSSALIAFTTGKEVNLLFDDTGAGCYFDRIIMYGNS